MSLLAGIVVWALFSVGVAVIARQIAVVFAKKRGWTDTTMPLKYYLWFFAGYSVVVYGLPALLIWIFG